MDGLSRAVTHWARLADLQWPRPPVSSWNKQKLSAPLVLASLVEECDAPSSTARLGVQPGLSGVELRSMHCNTLELSPKYEMYASSQTTKICLYRRALGALLGLIAPGADHSSDCGSSLMGLKGA